MAENTNTEREAFESALTKLCAGFGEEIGESDLDRAPSGAYVNGSTEVAWMLWQARASLSLPAAGQEPAAWMDDRGLVVSASWLASDDATSDYRAAYNIPLYAAPQPAVAAGWVSVKDRLPEAYVGVLLVLDGKHVTTGEYMHSLSCFTWEPHDDELDDSTVTHWMHIPPAPSTEGESNGL